MSDHGDLRGARPGGQRGGDRRGHQRPGARRRERGEGREARERHAVIMRHSPGRHRPVPSGRARSGHDGDPRGARDGPVVGPHARRGCAPRRQRSPSRAHPRRLPDRDPDGRRRHRARPRRHARRGPGRPARPRAQHDDRRGVACRPRPPAPHPGRRRGGPARLVRAGPHPGRAQDARHARADAGHPPRQHGVRRCGGRADAHRGARDGRRGVGPPRSSGRRAARAQARRPTTTRSACRSTCPLLRALARHGLDHPWARVVLMSFEATVLRRLAGRTRLPIVQLARGRASASRRRSCSTGSTSTPTASVRTPRSCCRATPGERSACPPRSSATRTGAGSPCTSGRSAARTASCPATCATARRPTRSATWPAEVRALLAAGVDGVITDHPEAALAAAARGTAFRMTGTAVHRRTLGA